MEEMRWIIHNAYTLAHTRLPPQDRACEGMELFDELIESDVTIVVSHLSSVMSFCLGVATNRNLGNNIRVKALSFVSWLASLKKKVVMCVCIV